MRYIQALCAATSNVTINSGPSSIDGLTTSTTPALVNGTSRIFLSKQTTTSENGLWVWKGAGNAMTRPTLGTLGDQYKTGNVLDNATAIWVTNGDTLAGKVYGLDEAKIVTVDTTNHVYAEVALPPIQARVAATTNINLTSPSAVIIDGAGTTVTDGAMTTGSPPNDKNLTCSTSTPFTSTDVGRTIIVVGAGAAGADLATTIESYTSSSVVKLTTACSTNVSGATVRIGLRLGEVVLAPVQTTAADNGLYVWNGFGSAMTRSPEPLTPNRMVRVSEGTVNARGHFKIANQGAIKLNTTAPIFSTQSAHVLVTDFGAVGDGIADDSAAINAAAAFAQSIEGILFFPAGLTFAIEAQVVFNCNVEGHGATLLTSGALNSGACTAVLVGSSGAQLSWKKLRLPHITDGSNPAVGSWVGTFGSGTQRRGVECRNLLDCEVHFGHISKFVVGAWITSDSASGNANNRYYISALIDNAVALQLEPTASAGFVNENQFIGGDFEITGSVGVSYPGTRYVALVSPYSHPPDGNKFLQCDLEGDYPELHVDCEGNSNLFLHCRWETTTSLGIFPKVHLSDARNAFLYGYNAGAIVFSGDATSTQIFDPSAWKIDGGVAGTGAIITSNGSGSAEPAIMVMGTYSNGWMSTGASGAPNSPADPATDYKVAIAADWAKFKDDVDANPRIFVDTLNDSLFFGDGTGACDSRVGVNAAQPIVGGALEVYGSVATILGKRDGSAANYIECGTPTAGVSQFTYYTAGTTGIFLGVRISAANVASILSAGSYSLELIGQVDTNIYASGGDIRLTPVTSGKTVYVGNSTAKVNVAALTASKLVATDASKNLASFAPTQPGETVTSLDGSVWLRVGPTDGGTLGNSGGNIGVSGGHFFVIPGPLTGNRNITLVTTGASAGARITIYRLDTTANTYAVINGGGGGGTLYTFPNSTVQRATFRYDGTNWTLDYWETINAA